MINIAGDNLSQNLHHALGQHRGGGSRAPLSTPGPGATKGQFHHRPLGRCNMPTVSAVDRSRRTGRGRVKSRSRMVRPGAPFSRSRSRNRGPSFRCLDAFFPGPGSREGPLRRLPELGVFNQPRRFAAGPPKHGDRSIPEANGVGRPPADPPPPLPTVLWPVVPSPVVPRSALPGRPPLGRPLPGRRHAAGRPLFAGFRQPLPVGPSGWRNPPPSRRHALPRPSCPALGISRACPPPRPRSPLRPSVRAPPTPPRHDPRRGTRAAGPVDRAASGRPARPTRAVRQPAPSRLPRSAMSGTGASAVGRLPPPNATGCHRCRATVRPGAPLPGIGARLRRTGRPACAAAPFSAAPTPRPPTPRDRRQGPAPCGRRRGVPR